MAEAQAPSERYYGEVERVLSQLQQVERELRGIIRDQEGAHIPEALEGHAMLREAIASLSKIGRPGQRETKHDS